MTLWNWIVDRLVSRAPIILIVPNEVQDGLLDGYNQRWVDCFIFGTNVVISLSMAGPCEVQCEPHGHRLGAKRLWLDRSGAGSTWELSE